MSSTLRLARMAYPAIGLVALATGCSAPADHDPTVVAPGQHSFAVSQAMAGKITLRITPDSSPGRRYYFGSETDPTGVAGLTSRLEDARQANPTADTMFVYTYPHTRGYDVLMAINAARVAGIHDVEGYADFTDDASLFARMKWKHWSKSTDAAVAGSVRDSSIHTGR